MKKLAENKKAYHEYEILEKYEAGIVLNGQEVKSIRSGRASLKGSYVILRNGELYLLGASIPAYQPLNAPPDYNPERSRKLLLKKAEINRLIGKSKEKGLTLIPLQIYTKNARIKVMFAVARGKKKQDKREIIKKREAEREMRREMKKR